MTIKSGVIFIFRIRVPFILIFSGISPASFLCPLCICCIISQISSYLCDCLISRRTFSCSAVNKIYNIFWNNFNFIRLAFYGFYGNRTIWLFKIISRYSLIPFYPFCFRNFSSKDSQMGLLLLCIRHRGSRYFPWFGFFLILLFHLFCVRWCCQSPFCIRYFFFLPIRCFKVFFRLFFLPVRCFKILLRQFLVFEFLVFEFFLCI